MLRAALAGAVAALALAPSSAAAGAWSQPVEVGGDPDGSATLVGVARDGGAIAAWLDGGPNGPVASVRPAGSAFGMPVPVGGFASLMDLAVARSGHAIVASRDSFGEDRPPVSAALRAPGGDRFGPARVLGRDSASVPAAGIADDGAALVAFVAGRDGRRRRVLVAERPANGDSGRARALSLPRPTAVAVAVGADGAAAVAWVRRAGRSRGVVQLRVRAARARAFGRARTLSSPAQSAGSVRVAIDGEGRPIVVWRGTYRRGERSSVFASDGRRAPLRVSAAAEFAGAPAVGVAEDGEATVAWIAESEPDSVGRLFSGRVTVATRPAFERRFRPAEVLGGREQDQELASDPRVDVNEPGDVAVAWNVSTLTAPFADKVAVTVRPNLREFEPTTTFTAPGGGTTAGVDVALEPGGPGVATWGIRADNADRVYAAFYSP